MRRLIGVMGIGCLMSAWGARICAAQVRPSAEERLVAAEKALQALQGRCDALKAEVARMRAEQATHAKSTASPAATSAGEPHLFGYLQSQFDTCSAEGASRLFLRRVRLGVRGTLERSFRYEV